MVHIPVNNEDSTKISKIKHSAEAEHLDLKEMQVNKYVFITRKVCDTQKGLDINLKRYHVKWLSKCHN